jgi:hypothetical protein
VSPPPNKDDTPDLIPLIIDFLPPFPFEYAFAAAMAKSIPACRILSPVADPVID